MPVESTAKERAVGFAPEEVDLALPTRSLRLKWVVVVDAALPPGRAANAVACVASATSPEVGGLLGTVAVDAEGSEHAALPWTGCTVLAADADTLRTVRAKAAAAATCFVADMPAAAQHTRVYAEYLDTVKGTAAEEMAYSAVSIVGPRNKVDKLVGRLPLMP